MTFVSFAQNQEDVMLYRALRDVKQGFYIDVGAQDPVIDSVTKAFYDRGWHGINIEPNEEYFRKLQGGRPHDINLASAVGRAPGVIDFYEVAHTGLSTTNAGYAQRHSEAGYQVERREVPCTTLDRICGDCSVATVHFLKIDVEGSERGVLEGFSFEAVRPWLVVVEAIEPNSDHEVFAEWEDLLLGRRYRFVYFDGLNRFYAAEEHAELARHFSRPPNWFDQYVTYQLWRTRAELDEVQAAERNALVNSLTHLLAEVQSVRADAQTLREAIAERDRRLGSLQRSLASTQRRLQSLRSSISWKLTSPLRDVRRVSVRIVGLLRRLKRSSELATSALASSDFIGPDEITAGVNEPSRLLYGNRRETALLPRRLRKKPIWGRTRI